MQLKKLFYFYFGPNDKILAQKLILCYYLDHTNAIRGKNRAAFECHIKVMSAQNVTR